MLDQKKKKKKKKRLQLPLRLNILFIFVFGLFSLLVIQLGVVQIINGEEAQQKINQTENTPSEKPVPRGKIYDRNLDVVLDNEAVKSITYTPPKNGDSAANRLKLAEKLAEFVMIIKDEEELKDEINERDKKEYWYLKNTKDALDKLTEEDRKELTTGEQYQTVLDRITEQELTTISWNVELLNVLAIKKELDQAFELSPHVIVNEGITDEEYAQVSEHLLELSGIDAVIDWERKKMFGTTFNSYIGGISDSEEGIPRENSDYYLANGYTWNDRVGKSGLEKQYENILRGRKEKIQFTTDTKGNVIGSEVVVEGQRGKDLILTLDMQLQQAVDEIVEEELKKAMNSVNNNGYLQDALVAMMDPQTGDVLALSAVRYDREDKTYSDNSYRVIYDAHEPGSTVKGATVLTGYETGAIDIGTRFSDKAIQIANDPPKKSYRFLGYSLSEVDALEMSSNVYMFRTALKISGATYIEGENLRNFNNDAFGIMRKHFSEFGLGVETGIDLPFEATGVRGGDPVAGNLLDLAIGQYDTYTTLQLAQYVSTIANDGYRVKPHLVKEIREPGNEENKLGPVLKQNTPEVLNRVSMDDRYIDRVQLGFERVFTGGTARSNWSGFEYDVAGKTGTAEKPKFDESGNQIAKTENLSLIGYSPVENPEVAFAIIVPENGTGDQYAVHHEIGKRIISKYYELKKNRIED
ncbi:peptidoglycan D,D-transpeptidase FtsI family protein [Saliterribacillus persicus]|uniref:serine-type D-Ala-D-Ala carboxypeptidase n=1 Tax=Saliterribacillus persicus TaxID=930114 RepID=A0A368XBN0_9BACI|nr:penicillin-binding protein 2 [Saliterribacillus persicus]RCW65360.1 cell elongation-specific peptidoglycan D,D-transpeptidase [Saliterribacillus persicus]